MELNKLKSTLSDRRGFAKTLGMASAGIGMFLANAEKAPAAVTDADIVQFALNLEYLEAEFYTVASTGKRLIRWAWGSREAEARAPQPGAGR